MSRLHPARRLARPAVLRARELPALVAVAAASLLLVSGLAAQSGSAGGAMEFHAASGAASELSMAWDELSNVNPAGALPHLQKAMSMDPDFGLARILYGFGAPGLPADQRGREIDRGMGMMGGASAPEVLLGLAWREWNAGHAAEAIAATRAASELVPGDPRLGFQLAQLQAPGAPGPDQIAALKAILADHPDFAPAYNNLAYASWAAGDHEAGLAAVKRYAELLPDHPNPHDSYAELLQWNGQYDQAAAEYARAAELDPGFYEAYMGLAELSWLGGKHDEARAHIREAMEKVPDGSIGALQTARALANSWLMDGKTKQAMEGLAAVARDAEAQGAKNFATGVHRQMAVAYAMLGKGQEVETQLAAADALTGEGTPGSHAWSALAYASSDQLDRAEAALDQVEKAVTDNPGLASVLRTGRAMVLLSRNQADQALAALGEPDGDLGKAVSAQCMKKLARKDDAAKMKAAVLGEPAFSFYDPIRPFAVMRASKA
ncbi:MAG TPA: tetratricopeptide repeat protein [Gemmatimonadota bacterium]|nr:tetratricopeptide repeat protein [Gemmatimonadota bacterium]